MGIRAITLWKQRQAKTRMLWVPRSDLSDLLAGRKTEIRLVWRRNSIHQMHFPTPTLLYNAEPPLPPSAGLALLEKAWVEPFGAISGESLQRCGFESVEALKHWWIATYHARARPFDLVRVYQLQPWNAETRERAASGLLEAVYGHLPGFEL